MANISDFVKEDLIQHCLQYQWLDETRTKLVDRFFILVVAVFTARCYFDNFLSEKPVWLVVLNVFAIVVLVGLARTIISYRRQQRGHWYYIVSMRETMLENIDKPPTINTVFTLPDFTAKRNRYLQEYIQYLKGKKVNLTTWIEFMVIFITGFTPFLLVDIIVTWVQRSEYSPFWHEFPKWPVLTLSIVLTSTIWYCFLIPWYVYNFKEKIPWDKL